MVKSTSGEKEIYVNVVNLNRKCNGKLQSNKKLIANLYKSLSQIL